MNRREFFLASAAAGATGVELPGSETPPHHAVEANQPLDQSASEGTTEIAIEWQGGRPSGQIVVSDGTLEKLKVVRGQGNVEGSDRFRGQENGALRLGLQIKGTDVSYGKGRTIVTVQTAEQSFQLLFAGREQGVPDLHSRIWCGGHHRRRSAQL